LQLTWRVDQAPDGRVTLGMGCGEGCAGSVDVGDMLRAMPEGEWTQAAIPVSCLIESGLELDTVQNALAISTASAAQISLHQVSLINGDGSALCP
ncbi:MAG: putative glycoside hydrolase, partial [Pseudomonadota bacterium]